jgi:hypothetical protein
LGRKRQRSQAAVDDEGVGLAKGVEVGDEVVEGSVVVKGHRGVGAAVATEVGRDDAKAGVGETATEAAAVPATFLVKKELSVSVKNYLRGGERWVMKDLKNLIAKKPVDMVMKPAPPLAVINNSD